MKIAMMVRGYLPVPRPADIIYAPIDLAVAIAKGLQGLGHEVDVFAPLGSTLDKVNIENLNLRPLATNEPDFRKIIEDPGLQGHVQPALWDGYMAQEMFRRAQLGQYDLLFFHHSEVALPLAHLYPTTPVVYTLHDPIFPWYKELFELYNSPNQHFVSISDNQRRDAPDLPYTATIYNGLDTKNFPLSLESEDYLLIAGRVVPEKGFKEAIELAKMTDHRLLMIGPVYPDMQGYFDQYIKPHLTDKILYLGPMEQSQLVRYYQKAKAFITPLQWEEPFGLTTIEAMSCGTPVISLQRGAAPEIIQDGTTGFVVQCIRDMADAVGKIDTIKRRDCHAYVKQHFSTDQMVKGYEAAFDQILSRAKLGRLRRNLTGTVHKATKPVARLPKHVKKAVTRAKTKSDAQDK